MCVCVRSESGRSIPIEEKSSRHVKSRPKIQNPHPQSPRTIHHTVTMKLLFTALSLWFPMAAAFTPSSSTQMKIQAPHISTSNYNSHIRRSYKVNNHNPSRTNNQWHLNAKSDAEKEEEERKKKVREEIFWAKQRAMAAEMEASSDAALKK